MIEGKKKKKILEEQILAVLQSTQIPVTVAVPTSVDL